MPVIASPNYYNPQMGQVAQNLGVMLFGDPEARMKRDYYESASEENRATAGKLDAETTFQLGRNQAQASVRDAIQKGALVRQPNESDLAYMTRAQGYLSAIGGLATTAKDASDAITGGLGTLYATSPTEQGAHTSMTVQGKVMGVNDYGTPEGQLAGQNREIKGKENVANIGARAEVQKQQIHEGAESDRFYAKPQNVGAGDTLAVPKKFQERSGLGPTLYGMPTETVAKGEAARRVSAGKASAGDRQVLASGGAGQQPLEVPPGELGQIETTAAMQIPGATTGAGNKRILVSGFEKRLDPVRRQAALQAASDTYRNTHGDSAAATNAYLNAMGIPAGSTYSKGVFGLGSGMNPPAGGAPAAEAAPAAAGPAPGKVPMLNGERIYPSPDGRGWVYRDGRPAQ